MATTTIPWGDGSGDNIYLTYSSASGDQTVEVSSDANTGGARTQTVTFTSGVGSITRQLTINQEAGGPQYVSSGLVFWLDGIDKGPDGTAWIEKMHSYSFANNGGVFNSDHVYLDGSSYLVASGVPAYNNSGGNYTIEVVYEKETTSGIVFWPSNARYAICLGFNSNGRTVWSYARTGRPLYDAPSSGSISISTARALANGTAMTSNGTNYYSAISQTNTYIGQNANGATRFKGKIYSIRIYNKQLTEDEVLANLAVDNQRFNLGLTL